MWVGLNEYNPEDMCPICHDDYGTTQAIFKTPCGHLFHNNCLLSYCDTNQGNVVCPICRADIEESCNDVYAFASEAEYIMLQSVIDVIRT